MPRRGAAICRGSSSLNRLDRERASLERTLESLRQSCGRAIVPIQLPIGEEKDFKGVVDLVAMKAYTFAGDGSGKVTEGAVPADMTDAANGRARQRSSRWWPKPTSS